MILDQHIQVSELCPIQFREPTSIGDYPRQYQYVPKILDEIRVQFLISEDIFRNQSVAINVRTETGYAVKSFTCSKQELSVGYYYSNAWLNLSDIQDEDVYFEIYTNQVVAKSVWYYVNPRQRKHLRKISYQHYPNDWNMIFDKDYFFFFVEGGLIPIDSRIEQETEDFIEQDMTNETVYGDSYEVQPFTFGVVGEGIPNYLRNKINRALLCDNFQVDGVDYIRTNGSKLEKTDDVENGLAIYKIDLQTIKNYLQ